MKRMMLLPVLFVLGTCPALFGTTFPQLALGGSPERYECVILVANKTDQVWSGGMFARKGNHDAWLIRWVAGGNSYDAHGVTFNLPPGGTIKVVSRSVSGELGVGHLVLTADSGSSDSDVTVSFFYNLLDEAGELLDSVSVPKSSHASDTVRLD